MAHVTQQEFFRAIEILAEDLGLQRLRDRLVRLNALVMRRRAVSVEHLANQLYQLTGGFRRQVPASVAVQALWSEQINEKLDEDAEKELEEVATAINTCLGERDKIIDEKREELDQHLESYERSLSRHVGPEKARMDMIIKAVQQVADRLREMPPPTDPVEVEGEDAEK
jgi:hypothetical protein